MPRPVLFLNCELEQMCVQFPDTAPRVHLVTVTVGGPTREWPPRQPASAKPQPLPAAPGLSKVAAEGSWAPLSRPPCPHAWPPLAAVTLTVSWTWSGGSAVVVRKEPVSTSSYVHQNRL